MVTDWDEARRERPGERTVMLSDASKLLPPAWDEREATARAPVSGYPLSGDRFAVHEGPFLCSLQ